MDSILLQKQIRDNAEELKNYLLDLKSWESEMKRKEAEISSTESSSQSHPPVRSKVKKLSKGQKKSESQREKPSKISGCDYASWEKFDVDKACEDLDNEEEKDDKKEEIEELFNEIEEDRKREEAVYEKERGNDFVKKQKWKEAIQCYSRAIKCYPHDAIFYANRALCYLKIQSHKSAETDSTTALQLDPNYVKAYQRRAMARAELGQLLEAKADLLKVLEIEPKNMASKSELAKIEKKINLKSVGKRTDKQTVSATPKTSAVKSQEEVKNHKELNNKVEKPIIEKETEKSPIEDVGKNKKDHTSSKENISEIKVENKATTSSSNNKEIEQTPNVSRLTENTVQETLWPKDGIVKLVKPINKAPHLRSKKPLKRITIQEVDNLSLIEDKGKIEPVSSVVEESRTEDISNETESLTEKDKKQEEVVNRNDVEIKNEESSSRKQTLEQNKNDKDASTSNVTEFNVEDILNQVPPVPSTSVQFYVGWKKVKSNPQLSYLYLKQIPGSQIAKLFGDSLESSTFSEIIYILETHFIHFKESLLPYMIGFSKVRRFSALVMFLSKADKAGIKNILNFCKEQGECSHEEYTDLSRRYEL